MKLTILLMLSAACCISIAFGQAKKQSSQPDSVNNMKSALEDTSRKPKAKIQVPIDAEDSDFQIKHPAFRLKLNNPVAPNGKTSHSSRRAWMLSTALPGTGQIYNHRYWKLPIIYGGFIGLIASIDFNTRYYNTTLQYYKILLVNPASPSVPAEYRNAPLTQVGSVKDFYRRNRDLSVIGAAILWLANSVDAYVDSELKGFDVSNSLSLRIAPAISPYGMGSGFQRASTLQLPYLNQPVYGLKLVMSIK